VLCQRDLHDSLTAGSRLCVESRLSGRPTGPLAQQAPVHRVAVLLQGGAYVGVVDGLRDGLKQLGLEDGKQVFLRVHDARVI